MSRNDLELRMYLFQDRGTAVLVGEKSVAPERTWWLPRSLIGYCRKNVGRPGEAPGYVFTLPEWKVEQSGLWDFVTN